MKRVGATAQGPGAVLSSSFRRDRWEAAEGLLNEVGGRGSRKYDQLDFEIILAAEWRRGPEEMEAAVRDDESLE